jgi:predicted dehydrogenase
MNEPYRVGIIGCGRPWKSEGSTGFGMARAHARGLLASGRARLVGLADPNRDNALAFQADLGGERLYADHREMLSAEKPDVVCISTWTRLHAPMVVDCAEARVRAVHCEKPMAPTFGECRRMVHACEESGTVLTINHQRRFLNRFREAKRLLEGGAIGKLERVEGLCPNLYDWGTHWFDMMNFLNGDERVEWVMGQLERRGGGSVFDVEIEGQGLSQFRYENGVQGLLTTGTTREYVCWIELTGSDGRMTVSVSHEPALRLWGRGHAAWRDVEVPNEGSDIDKPVTLAMLDLLDALENGREPELSGRRALRASELIFATYESSRKRGRVDLPLTVDDNAYHALLERGALA